MKNRKLRKFLMLVSSALLLVCVTVGATVAYLTATSGEVVNTFTVGNVSFNENMNGGLDESKVDATGTKYIKADGSETTTQTDAERVTSNEYKLVPAHTYIKDPEVHIGSGSEDAWLFVKVSNGLVDAEGTSLEGATTIHDQMTAGDDAKWAEINSDHHIYAYKTKVSAGANIRVFNTFTLAGNVTDAQIKKLVDDKANITIQAYLVQAEGLNTYEAAWKVAARTEWMPKASE